MYFNTIKHFNFMVILFLIMLSFYSTQHASDVESEECNDFD